MVSSNPKRDAGLGIGFLVSAILHLAVFLLLVAWNNFFPVTLTPEATYYVDITNLPVAAPQHGSSPAKSEAPALAPPPQPLSAGSMPLPPAPKKPESKSGPAKTAKPEEMGKTAADAADFDKRMSKLQGAAEARRQEENIERMRRKLSAAPPGKTGSATGSGSQSGSDYLSYITSRLSDAFNEPPNTGKQVFTELRIRINAAGKLELMEITRSSGNPAFDNYAKKSVYEAEKDFPPPPNGKFEFIFRFRPQGISHK